MSGSTPRSTRAPWRPELAEAGRRGGRSGAGRATGAGGGRSRRVADSPALRILGVDPGSRYVGYGIVDRRGSALVPVAHGRLCANTRVDMAERLYGLCAALDEIVAEHAPRVAVVESLFHGINPRTLIVLAQARGALLATLAKASLPVTEYSPAEIKSAVTGQGRADKEQVARMVRMILGLGDQKLANDTTDALAVAVCFAQRARFESAIAGGLPKRG